MRAPGLLLEVENARGREADRRHRDARILQRADAREQRGAAGDGIERRARLAALLREERLALRVAGLEELEGVVRVVRGGGQPKRTVRRQTQINADFSE
jgi:hypothetical protein